MDTSPVWLQWRAISAQCRATLAQSRTLVMCIWQVSRWLGILSKAWRIKHYFVACNSFSVPAVEKACKLTNNVFYTNEFNGCHFFCFKDLETYECEGSEAYDRNAKQGLNSVWIEPPQAWRCFLQLAWLVLKWTWVRLSK